VSAILREKIRDAIQFDVSAEGCDNPYGSPPWVDGIEDAATAVMAEVVTPLVELLLYIELHIGQYQWKVLTTDQKNLLADLIDEQRANEYPDDHTPMERWWT
jgi:hypothetical protein